ncbi:hypothetical protein [Amycolatopsis sp. SID8362]|uniref:hypothetical protein n=1 Tax=Amycolatopsis sp. SID8362 TaxID=2690346 RepID=UPI001368D454|nr:hypothetical protein [Amycolatopsis sp. SID8362]NBH07733.1 hypothetical protein [Amycolatopsis sp. SID8362]NED44428.1 hypothetical protein [Amycolatopsis sp. SID8362]
MIKTMLAKLLTAKLAVAAAAAAAVTVGGVAAVAATGNFPGSTDEHATSTPATATASGKPSVSTTEAAEASHGEGKSTGAEPSGSPSPSLVGLCHAYTAGDKAEHGKALENPAFTVLITTAGGKDNVDVYCTKVLADADDASTSAEPATPSAANDHTTQPHPTEGQGDAHKNEPTVTKPTHP